MKSFKVKTLDSGQRPPWSAKPQVMPSLSQVCVCCHPVLLFFILEKICWSIISLQCCVGFCYTTMWISYKYAFIPPSRGFPNGSASKESTSNAEDTSSWVGKIPWRRKWQHSPVFLSVKSHGQKSLMGCSPKGHKESEMTEQLSTFSPSLLSFPLTPTTPPPHLTHLGHHRATSWVPCVIQQFPTSYLFYTW